MQPSREGVQPLTVAEALVLQDPNNAQGRAALKLTMTDLLARRVLTLRHEETKGRFRMTHKVDYVRLTPEVTTWATQTPHVRAVVDVIASAAPAGTEPTMEQVVTNARKQFGTDLGGFKRDHIIPALLQRGLVEPFEHKILWVFPATRYRRTATGEAAAQQLQAQMEQARRIPSLLDGADPQEIAALVAGLGITLLLVDELRPHYGRLSQTLRTQHAGDGGATYGGGDTSGPNDRDVEPQEHSSDPGIDLDAGLGSMNLDSFDQSAFDTLDTSFDAFDSSFDASADSGGGGDGGGDGGGGGGGD